MKKNRKTKLRPLRIAHQYCEHQLKVGKNSSKASYQDPSPSLSIIDETCKDWREEITTDEKKAIDRYVSPHFVCEILNKLESVLESISLYDVPCLSPIFHTEIQPEPRKTLVAIC